MEHTLLLLHATDTEFYKACSGLSSWPLPALGHHCPLCQSSTSQRLPRRNNTPSKFRRHFSCLRCARLPKQLPLQLVNVIWSHPAAAAHDARTRRDPLSSKAGVRLWRDHAVLVVPCTFGYYALLLCWLGGLVCIQINNDVPC